MQIKDRPFEYTGTEVRLFPRVTVKGSKHPLVIINKKGISLIYSSSKRLFRWAKLGYVHTDEITHPLSMPEIVITTAITHRVLATIPFGNYSGNLDEWRELYTSISNLIRETLGGLQIGPPVFSDSPPEVRQRRDRVLSASIRKFVVVFPEKIDKLDIITSEKDALHQLGCDSFIEWETAMWKEGQDGILIENRHVVKLTLNRKRYQALGASISSLTNLQRLTLYGSITKEISPEIGNLSQLTWFEVNKTQLQALPPTIGNLTQIIHLNLKENQLESLPDEIGCIQNLESLTLSKNNLCNLPTTLGNLNHLKRLYATDNLLQALPNEIGMLRNLKFLSLGNNRLTVLPPSIGNLNKLERLYISNNEIRTLPVEIGQLRQLLQLDLQDNKLISLPQTITGLKNLTEILLKNNHLQSLPAEIGNLTKLEWLDLRNNPLKFLPAEFRNLYHVFLEIDDNVAILPKEGEDPGFNRQDFMLLMNQAVEENHYRSIVHTLQNDREAIYYFLSEVNSFFNRGSGSGTDHYINALTAIRFIGDLFYTHEIEDNSTNSKSNDEYWDDLFSEALYKLIQPEFLRPKPEPYLIHLIADHVENYLDYRELDGSFDYKCKTHLLWCFVYMMALSVYVNQS
ncbi:MAG: leucine-rich repeat domain-containing protein [Candidatus Hodarchaeota archaeon]